MKFKKNATCDVLSKLKSGRVAEKKRWQTIQIVDHTQLNTTAEQNKLSASL